jgi:hypothetical protein
MSENGRRRQQSPPDHTKSPPTWTSCTRCAASSGTGGSPSGSWSASTPELRRSTVGAVLRGQRGADLDQAAAIARGVRDEAARAWEDARARLGLPGLDLRLRRGEAWPRARAVPRWEFWEIAHAEQSGRCQLLYSSRPLVSAPRLQAELRAPRQRKASV